MKNTVPVQLDCMPTEVRGECAQCGKCTSTPVSQDRDDGSPKDRKAAAVAEVLSLLTAACELRLPWGVPPAHEDRRIPRGVSVFGEDAHGKLWGLSVNAKGKLETVAGGCHFDARVIVVWSAKKHQTDAIEFCAELKERGYKFARTASAGSLKKFQQGAKQ